MPITPRFRLLGAAVLTLACLPAAAGAQNTSLVMFGQTGDYIAPGPRSLTPANGTFSAQRNFDGGVTVRFDSPAEWWTLDFASPQSVPLVSGSFEGATRFPFQAASEPGLSVSGTGRGCNQLTGRFTVLEVEYGTADTINKFSANFEQHCEGGPPALFGSVRFNATSRPPHQVSVAVAGTGGGAVTSFPAGINCGAACTVTVADGAFTLLLATPSPGSGFRWTGSPDCTDGVILNGASVSCTVTYEPCAIAISPLSATAQSSFGSGVITVTANGPTCPWTATTTADWLNVFDLSGSGSDSIFYTYQPRGPFAQSRTATITVAGQTFTLTQLGLTPTFTVSPTLEVAPGAATSALQVSSNVQDVPWTATSNTSWISVPSSGLAGTLPVTLARNASPLPRIGTIAVSGHTVTVTQRGNGVPGEPLNLTASVQNGVARFTWTPPQTEGDALGYVLEAGVAKGTTAVAFPSGTPVLDVPGVPDGRFYIRVRGVNEYGTGVASDDYRLDVRSGMNPPGAPTNVTSNDFSPQLSMTWAAPSGGGPVEGYVLEVGSAPGAANFVVLPLGLATAFAYQPVPSGFFFLRVRAVNRAGSSPASNEVLYTFAALGPARTPTGLQSAVVGSTVNFSWQAPPSSFDVLRYRLEVGYTPGATDLVIDTPLPVTAIGFTGVPVGRYYVRVRAINVRGPGVASNEVYVHVR